MKTRRTFWRSLVALPLFASFARAGRAEPAPAPADDGKEMLTIFLKHDETKTLGEINEHLRSTGFFEHFPPPNVEVVSWYVMMGVGQVVTLRFPPERLREINRIIEGEAWGGYSTQFYPTYDYKAAYVAQQVKMKAAK